MGTDTLLRKDRELLRELARRVAEVAARPEQAEKARLWTACNDLTPERPMVYLDPQGGWPELEAAWLTLSCEGEWACGVEKSLRTKLLRQEQLPDDYPITGVHKVPIRIENTGYDDYGLQLEVRRPGELRGAYHITQMIKGAEDLERLHPRPIRVDHERTAQDAERARDAIGDLLPVVVTGKTGWRYGLSRVLIHMRGLDQMMLDMYDNPELIHRLMGFLRDDFMAEIDLLEREEAVSLNNLPDSGTGSGGLSPTRALPLPDYDGRPRVSHCVCWAESQETVGVGPAQFEEFVLRYQLPLVRRFGLTDYGCCEPLDHKLDLLLASIPNLRWVSVSPWADRRLCAEKLGGRYVYVYKPNPSRICARTCDWEAAERDVRETIALVGGAPMHIIMKDTHTFYGDASRATRWCEMAVRAARGAA